MQQSSKNEKQAYGINRREFCRTVPCAAAGVLASSSLMGINVFTEEFFLRKEGLMPNIVTAKVISQKGTCDMGHKVGDVVTFTESGIDGKICIHALYSILPKVFAMMYDAQFPWLENPDVSTSACPDAANPLVFEVSRKKA